MVKIPMRHPDKKIMGNMSGSLVGMMFITHTGWEMRAANLFQPAETFHDWICYSTYPHNPNLCKLDYMHNM
jgi:hypothetical protein